MKLETLPSWGPRKTKKKFAPEIQISVKFKKGRSATKHKETKHSHRNKHSKIKRGFRSACLFLSSEESFPYQVFKANLKKVSASIASVHHFHLLHCLHLVPQKPQILLKRKNIWVIIYLDYMLTTQCYQATVLLNSNSEDQLQWRIQYLEIVNGYYLIQCQNSLKIRAHAFKKDGCAACHGVPAGGE